MAQKLSKHIVVGSLVCMFRRNEKGLGVAVKVVENLPAQINFNPNCLQRDSYPSRMMGWWNAVEINIFASTDPEAARAYVNYNHWGGAKKIKLDFTYVKWIKKPSDHQYKFEDTSGWVPTEWLRAIK